MNFTTKKVHKGTIQVLKFTFSKKATKIDEIFTVDLTLCSRRQIDGEDFVNFCGPLRKHELYMNKLKFELPIQSADETNQYNTASFD